MKRITYYTEDRSFVCLCGHTWYALKQYPNGYKERSIKCNTCLHECIPIVKNEFAPVEIQNRYTHGRGFFAVHLEQKREVWCKRCEQWFVVDKRVKKWPVCPKCDMVTNMNYAKATGKYREWEEWENTRLSLP